MPRAGGVYTLPAGNPVVTLTVISSSWANTTMSDIATALTGSLPTDGSAPLTGPLRLVDGIGGAPGLTWGSETTSGWYRIGLNQFGFSVASNLALSVNANRGWTIPTPVAATVALTINSVANTAGLSIIGQAGSNAILALRDGQAGTTLWSISVGVGAVGELDIINNTAGTTPLKISAAGNLTVAAPSAGVAATVSGFAGSSALQILVTGVQIGAPTGGDKGLGTLNVSNGLYINGNQVFAGALASANTTADITDIEKTIVAAGNIAINNAIFSQGHWLQIYNNTAGAITINGTITTMRLAASATTGNRSLVARGMAYIWFVGASECVVSGPGVA